MKWWHIFLWRSQRILESAWTARDKYYFVVDGTLYVMTTNGSDKPCEWTWSLVTHL